LIFPHGLIRFIPQKRNILKTDRCHLEQSETWGDVSQANEAQQIGMLVLVEASSKGALQEVGSRDAYRLELPDATDIEFVELVSF
jgi:hypothetical protein